jgi:dimeric dUTPase (all-alpha-NTP-PPase superfamily)
VANDFDFSRVIKKQKELQEAYGSWPVEKQSDKNKVLKDQIFCLEQELSEALRCFDWKAWSKGSEIDKARVKEELRDAFQFFANCMIVVDFKPEELQDMLEEKQKMNWRRIDNDYNARIDHEKDPE